MGEVCVCVWRPSCVGLRGRGEGKTSHKYKDNKGGIKKERVCVKKLVVVVAVVVMER